MNCKLLSKGILSKSLVLMLALLFSADLAFSQTGNTGVVFAVEVFPKCEDNGVTQTNFVSTYAYRIGNATPQLIGHFDETGATYTINDVDDVTLGFCQASVTGGTLDTLYDYEIVPKCDGGETPFYTLVLNKTLVSTGVVTTSKIDDYDSDGASYTPSGTVTAGYCTSLPRVERGITRIVTSASGTLLGTNSIVNIEISNVGFADGTINPGGGALELLPGERWYCHAVLDRTNNVWNVCPDISWDASGTTYHITVREIPE